MIIVLVILYAQNVIQDLGLPLLDKLFLVLLVHKLTVVHVLILHAQPVKLAGMTSLLAKPVQL